MMTASIEVTILVDENCYLDTNLNLIIIFLIIMET